MAPRRTRASLAAQNEQQLSSPPETPAPATKRSPRGNKQDSNKKIKKEPTGTSTATPARTRKRARTPPSEESSELSELDELPHNLGRIATPESSDGVSKRKTGSAAPPKKRARAAAKSSKVKAESEDVKDVKDVKDVQVKADASPVPSVPAKVAKAKKNKYGFMPGETPYPNYPHPTPEECYEVDRILSKVHGKVKQPEAIPVPSVTVAGCGEVPSVLDALIRTRLSAATTTTNSSRAFQGLVKTFGTIKEGIGAGSVNWNAVRLASQPEIFEAIKAGGLAQVKSRDIKAILEQTHTENQARKAALKSSSKPDPAGAENEPTETKQSEVEQAESNVLSLDHLHMMDTQDAIDHMVTFPGIGAKTAACVALFCMRRSCFAVDTHVFRLCQYLNWVPPADEVQPGEPKVGRNTAYTHCEVRVPDELKYSLHQLLIKHGKVCPRCRAATSTSSEKWEEGCPIEHLVTRYGAKKGGAEVGGAPKKKNKKPSPAKSASEKDTPGKAGAARNVPKRAVAKKAKKVVESDGSEEDEDLDVSEAESAVDSSDLSDLGSDSE